MRARVLATYCLGIALTLGACGSGEDRDVSAGKSDSRASSVQGDSEAASRCSNRADYKDATLRAAYTTTAGDMIEWIHQRNGGKGFQRVTPDFLAGRPTGETLTMCVIDGEFAIPVPDGTPPMNRGVLLIDQSGKSQLQAAGYHDKPGQGDLPTDRPPQDQGGHDG